MVSNLLKFHPTDEYAYCDPTPTETITPSPTTIASPLGTATETPASPDMPTPLSFNGPAVFSIQYFRPQLALLAPKTPTFTVTATPTVTDTPTMTPTATDTPTSTTTSTSAATHTAIPIPPEPVTIDYAYDPLHRLTSANYSTGDYYHYTYDSVGNRLTEESKVKGLLSAVDYVYDEANRLTSVDNVAYTWDANGNLLNDGVNTYTYDSANRLTAVNGPSSTVEYTYNGLGDRLIQNNVQYTLDLNAGLTQVLGDGEHTYLYGNGRISQTGNSTEYFLGDALGSVRQLTNEEAEITLTKAYEPYGEEAWSYGEGQTDYGFAAEWADTNGLIHLRARHYNPLDGRFFQKDPWDGDANLPATFNPYLYALNNPLIYTDPSGEIPQLLALMGIGFVAGVALGAIVGIADRGWALSGQCGCDIQEIAQSTGDFEWIGYHALVGGLIGGSAPVLAAIAAASPLGAIAIGGIGVVLGGKDLYNTAQIIINEQKGHPTWCTGIRAAVDILIIIFGGATAIKGWQAGVAAWRSSGSLLSWVAPGATGAGLQPPNWVRSAGAFVNWMKNLQREYLLTGRIMSSSEIDSIIAIARGYRVAIRLDPPHAKPPWNIPHLNIGAEGQAHIPVPPGYKLP